MNKTFTRKLEYGLFEGADQVKLAEHGGKKGRICCFPVFLGGLNLNPGLGRLKRGMCGHDGVSSLR
jgi:hypothetical protein